MEKSMKKLVLVALAAVAMVGMSASESFAQVFNISWRMEDGSTMLELNAAPKEPTEKAVIITVNTDVGASYNVRHLINITNRDTGATLGENLVVRTKSDRNAVGTIYPQTSNTSASVFDQIYQSNPAGDSYEFSLVYGVVDPKPGIYSGTIMFVLSPEGSAVDQKTVTLNVSINAAGKLPQAMVNLSLEDGGSEMAIRTSPAAVLASQGYSGIKAASDEESQKRVKIAIENGFTSQFYITQTLAKAPVGRDLQELDYKKLYFEVQGVDIGKTMAIMPTPLSMNEQTIYISGESGQADEVFYIAYGVNDLKLKAGLYKGGLIKYKVHYQGEEFDLGDQGNLEFSAEQPTVFTLNVAPDQGKISFDIEPFAQQQESKVAFKVTSNVGSYKVYQRVLQPLANESKENSGVKMPPEYFTLKAKGAEGKEPKGKFGIKDKQQVAEGSTVLYSSDPDGSSAEFTITYTIDCVESVPAGTYRSKVVYDLLQDN